MDDNGIIRLYWDRDHHAINATSEKYGHYCKKIARTILGSEEDAEECVNDTYLNAWNSMPPHRPENLAAYLGKITRGLAFNKYRRDHAEKRGGGETALILDELADHVSGAGNAEQIVEGQELIRAVNTFVRSLPVKKRVIFTRRYWYADSVSDIAKDCGMPRVTVSKTLERMRKQLKAYLTERGFDL